MFPMCLIAVYLLFIHIVIAIVCVLKDQMISRIFLTNVWCFSYTGRVGISLGNENLNANRINKKIVH